MVVMRGCVAVWMLGVWGGVAGGCLVVVMGCGAVVGGCLSVIRGLIMVGGCLVVMGGLIMVGGCLFVVLLCGEGSAGTRPGDT